jgi:hypothetical protein
MLQEKQRNPLDSEQNQNRLNHMKFFKDHAPLILFLLGAVLSFVGVFLIDPFWTSLPFLLGGGALMGYYWPDPIQSRADRVARGTKEIQDKSDTE